MWRELIPERLTGSIARGGHRGLPYHSDVLNVLGNVRVNNWIGSSISGGEELRTRQGPSRP